MKKESKLVNLRVFAILSVVFSHSVILYSKSWNLYESIHDASFFDTLKKIVGFYQMPLFFSLSGYLFYYTCLKNRSFTTFIKDKFLRLIVPFIFITILWVTPVKMLLDVPGFNKLSYFELLFKNLICLKSTGHLWFCIALFIIFIICYILNKIFKISVKDKKHIVIDFIILLLAGIFVIKYDLFKEMFPMTAINRVFLYLFWFYIGFCINKYFSLGKDDNAYEYKFVPYLALLTGALIIWRLTHNDALVKLLTTMCIVLICYLIIPSKINKLTEYIDRNSMGMFLFHSVFIYISYTFYPNINPIFMFLINFVLFGTISSLLAELIRKTPFRFIIGERNKR